MTARPWLQDAADEYKWRRWTAYLPDFLYLENENRQAHVWFGPTGRIRSFDLRLATKGQPTVFIPTRTQHKREQVFFWMLDGSGTDINGHRMPPPNTHTCDPRRCCMECHRHTIPHFGCILR